MDATDTVRNLTYYPIMSSENCWFKIETHKGAGTYHQCDKHGRVRIYSYPFCERHAKMVAGAIIEATKSLSQQAKLNPC